MKILSCMPSGARLAYTCTMPSKDLLNHLRQRLADFGGEIVCAYLYGSDVRGGAGRGGTAASTRGVLQARDPPRTLEGLRFDIADRL